MITPVDTIASHTEQLCTYPIPSTWAAQQAEDIADHGRGYHRSNRATWYEIPSTWAAQRSWSKLSGHTKRLGTRYQRSAATEAIAGHIEQLCTNPIGEKQPRLMYHKPHTLRDH